MREIRLLAAVALASLVAGCGGAAEPTTAERELPVVRVALDFVPNAVHAPLFQAVDEGLDRRRGVRLEILPPGSAPDSVKLLTGGRADLGLLDIHDLGIARERGADIVGIGALVGKPLAALLAQPDIRRPADLEGRRVGVSGLPSDPAFVKAMVADDGGDPEKVRFTTIGFQAVSALLSQRVSAVPAFWNAEGVALTRRGKDFTELRVERYGAPEYPEVVLLATRERLDARRDDLRRAVAAIADGIEAARARPERAVQLVAAAAGDADPELVRAQLDAVAPIFADGARLERPVLEAWADFDAQIGIVDRRPDVARAFDFGVAATR